MKKLLLAFATATLLAGTVAAQEDGKLTDLNGTYTMQGSYADGSEPYTGTGSFTGLGSVYTTNVQYSYQDEPYTSPFLLVGNVMVDSYGAETCSEVAYVRDEEGIVMGLFIDEPSGDGTGMETLTPTAPTQDFVGTYEIHGMYPTGQIYHGTVEITRGENDLYMLMYNYPADEVNPALTTTAYGLMSGNILGVSLQLSPDGETCGIFVGQVQPDRSYTSIWYDGKFGMESGTPSN